MTLHETADHLVEIRIGDARVGDLSPKMSGELSPVLRHLAERGLVTAARAMVRGNSGTTEVMLYIARVQDLPESWQAGPSRQAAAPSAGRGTASVPAPGVASTGPVTPGPTPVSPSPPLAPAASGAPGASAVPGLSMPGGLMTGGPASGGLVPNWVTPADALPSWASPPSSMPAVAPLPPSSLPVNPVSPSVPAQSTGSPAVPSGAPGSPAVPPAWNSAGAAPGSPAVPAAWNNTAEPPAWNNTAEPPAWNNAAEPPAWNNTAEPPGWNTAAEPAAWNSAGAAPASPAVPPAWNNVSPPAWNAGSYSAPYVSGSRFEPPATTPVRQTDGALLTDPSMGVHPVSPATPSYTEAQEQQAIAETTVIPALAAVVKANSGALAAVSADGNQHPAIPPAPTGIKFVVPPGWPLPPDGWYPPEGWRPDPSWPLAPTGWQWWVPAWD
ncbi:hypothetical protein [Actinoplanes sp. CA-252034]|uniref:hypothetical protein n=1 Tax=Actinoplanes sp. CA-252034 TaxID=3239906 RepID=UPI003D992726